MRFMSTLYASMRTFTTKVRTLPLPIASPEPLLEDSEWQPVTRHKLDRFLPNGYQLFDLRHKN